MKTTNQTKWGSFFFRLAISLILINFFLAQPACAFEGPPGPGGSLPTPLDSWSFTDHSNWTDDYGDAPNSFTNITWAELGDGNSLVMETNVPAWLNYEIYQTSTGATNLVVNGPGSITLWYGPGWATTNGGPNQWAQLIDIGEWTPDSSVGYWGLSIDPAGSNLWFLAQDGMGNSYSISAPISWTTNDFQFIVLTYSATNVSLYLNGQLMTNDPGGLSVWPDSAVLANGVYFGSSTNGNFSANGLFDTVQTYNFPLDSNTVNEIYSQQLTYFEISPWNIPYMDALSSAPSDPSTNSSAPDVITGAGYLQYIGPASGCSYSTNAYYVWITNLVVTASSNGLMNVTFSINGGQSNYVYDVFATGALEIPLSSGIWSWMGQGASCNTYTIPNVNSTDCLLILGTPQDTSGADLTDAYQLLVSKTNPNVQDSDLDGLITGWDVLLGLNPHLNNAATQAERANYGYTTADWLNTVTGVKSGTVTTDPEGNVTQVSQ